MQSLQYLLPLPPVAMPLCSASCFMHACMPRTCYSHLPPACSGTHLGRARLHLQAPSLTSKNSVQLYKGKVHTPVCLPPLPYDQGPCAVQVTNYLETLRHSICEHESGEASASVNLLFFQVPQDPSHLLCNFIYHTGSFLKSKKKNSSR